MMKDCWAQYVLWGSLHMSEQTVHAYLLPTRGDPVLHWHTFLMMMIKTYLLNLKVKITTSAQGYTFVSPTEEAEVEHSFLSHL